MQSKHCSQLYTSELARDLHKSKCQKVAFADLYNSFPIGLDHAVRCSTYLWHKNQTQRDGAAEDDDQCHDAELHIRLISGQEGHCCPNDTHDAHIIHTHTDVLAVVQGWNAHISGLPGQKTPKQLDKKKKEKSAMNYKSSEILSFE